MTISEAKTLVLEKTDIVELISEFATLKQDSRGEYVGLSVFNHEKTASMRVRPAEGDYGVFKDFSSGNGGDAIRFVMDLRGIGFMDALQYLAQRLGIDIKANDADVPSAAKAGLRIMKEAEQMWHEKLIENSKALDYLLSDRELDIDVLTSFSHGLVTDWRELGYNEDEMIETGIVRQGEHGIYQPLLGRICFPIRDAFGKTVSFGGRVWSGKSFPASAPKYLNGPATIFYDKSAVLYGLYEGREKIRKSGVAYIVEGYMDVNGWASAGYSNVVASCGTALSATQVHQLRRICPDIVLCRDGDLAGEKRIGADLKVMAQCGVSPRILHIQPGLDGKKLDPDDLRKADPFVPGIYPPGALMYDSFIEYFHYFYRTGKAPGSITALSNAARGDSANKKLVITEMMQVIKSLEDPIDRKIYMESAASVFGIDRDDSESMLRSMKSPIPGQAKPEPRKPDWRSDLDFQLCLMMYHHGDTKVMWSGRSLMVREVVELDRLIDKSLFDQLCEIANFINWAESFRLSPKWKNPVVAAARQKDFVSFPPESLTTDSSAFVTEVIFAQDVPAPDDSVVRVVLRQRREQLIRKLLEVAGAAQVSSNYTEEQKSTLSACMMELGKVFQQQTA